MIENNIFKYAPNELVQDAFICWLLNWIKTDRDEEEIKKVAKDFLREIILDYDKSFADKVIDYSNFKILTQYQIELNNYKEYDENNKKFFQKKECLKKVKGRIDILVIVDRFAIIIEDKVNTGEHDFQMYQYKNALETEITNKTENEVKETLSGKKVIACYYKIYDECNIKGKKYIDSVFDRERILLFFEKYCEIKNLFFSQYINYIKRIDYYSKLHNQKENINKEILNDCFLKPNMITDIRYLGLMKELEQFIENDKSFPMQKVYWGKSNESGARDTWWCNIEIDLFVEDSKNFREKAFLKINAYEKDNIKIRLMIGKKIFEIKENEERENNIRILYEYSKKQEGKDCIVAKYQEKNNNYNEIKNKVYLKLQKERIIEKINNEIGNYECKLGGNSGNYEMTIFTIKTDLNINSSNIYTKLKNLINILNKNLKNFKIKELQGV